MCLQETEKIQYDGNLWNNICDMKFSGKTPTSTRYDFIKHFNLDTPRPSKHSVIPK